MVDEVLRSSADELAGSGGTPEYLTAELESLRSRMLEKWLLPAARVRKLWGLVAGWAEFTWRETGQRLPAPGVFATLDGEAQFKWELPGRFLVLNLGCDGWVEFYRRESKGASEAAETAAVLEGECTLEEVSDLLQWLVSV